MHSNNEAVMTLSGDLTFDTVSSLYLKSRTTPFHDNGTVDLTGVTLVDSAGLALLLEWQSDARKRNSRLAFINAPSDLLRLAALSESTTLLGLAARSVVSG